MIVLGIGSSIEPKEKYLKEALKFLNENKYINIVKESRIYLTRAWGGVAKNTFLNMCVAIEFSKSPYDLLEIIQEIEVKLDRVRDRYWDDRTIDIDILLFEDKVFNDEILTIPHKYILERNFVYYPLFDVCGNIEIKGVFLEKLIKDNKEFIEVYKDLNGDSNV